MSDTSELVQKDLVRQLGMLAKQRREEIGISRDLLAKEAGIEARATIEDFEHGKHLPSGDTQRKLEKALGWRLGAIKDAMGITDRQASTITMEELDAEDSQYLASQGAIPSLALVSDDDLLAEVARRFRRQRGEPVNLGKSGLPVVLGYWKR
ncbi:helix-turn-helix transcriptional regulator [Arthrobacter sp. ZGTC131]|uniref:helix-turn-helix domain-containing protein n=1 Tax=Arthrobacter sp. ZGTC131 TaxID=2058898 RepID=UPI0015E3387F|nr:helix-turn-helix transcriptional regulator [Arthrobacter sp. ZGTC131]